MLMPLVTAENCALTSHDVIVVTKGVVCTAPMSVRVSYSRTFAQSNRETTVSFQDAYSNSKTVVGVVFHKFPADSDLRRVPVGTVRHTCVRA